MTEITEEQTESEYKKVEETTTIRKIKCDVCGHAYPEDEWSGNEFAVNPGISERYHTLYELADILDAYYVWVDREIAEETEEERVIKTPKEDVVEALKKEHGLMSDGARYALNNPTEAKKYADSLGTLDFYIDGDKLHHFAYEVDIEATTDDYKHVCDECYDIFFDDS